MGRRDRCPAGSRSSRRRDSPYDGTHAVNSLELRVPAHSVFGFLGPNGAGKTTTMKMLLGPIRPTAGSGRIFGLDSLRDSPELRRRVGYLPQEPRFYPHMTARETLRFAASFFFSGPNARLEARIGEMLELVGLEGRADRPVKTLSGGETQRLGVAQAQIHEPELLILDEPAATLDPLGRRDVLAILDRFKVNSTVLYSTHILDDVQRVSDLVCILKGGRIVMQGPLGEVLSGGSEAVFTAEIEGDVDRARTALLDEAWVRHVGVDGEGASAKLWVTVDDPEAAAARLLRVLLTDEDLIVKEFIRPKATLEDVFVDLVTDRPAKLVPKAVGVLATMIAVPSAILAVQLTLAGVETSLPRFALGASVAGLNLMFYLTLTLMLGVLLDSAGVVIAVPLAFAFGQQLFASLPGMGSVLPSALIAPVGGAEASIAGAVIVGAPVETPSALIVTGVACVAFTVVWCWRWNRTEL